MRTEARVVYTDFFLSNPLSAAALRSVGLESVVRAGRNGGPGHRGTNPYFPLHFEDAQWSVLLETLGVEREPDEGAMSWPIASGAVLSRSEVHDVFGGARGSVECSNQRTMNDLLFVDRQPDDPELVPRWDGDVLLAAGQPLVADSTVAPSTAGHLSRGRALRVFETRGELCLYIGEFVIDQAQAVDRWVDGGRKMTHPRRYYGPPLARGNGGRLTEYRVPALRIRQLNGIDAFTGTDDPFDGATPVKLGLSASPSAARPPETVEQTQVAEMIRSLTAIVERDPASVLSLESMNAAEALHTLVQRQRRQSDLDGLRAAVADPKSLEGDLQKLLERMLWLFGGGFLPTPGRRTLTSTDQLDLSLIRPDGSLHGVEIKRARIQPFLTMHRNYPVFGHEVYKAVAQAMNYLTRLDEQRDRILLDYGIDAQRATMSVLIGSAIHTHPYGPEQIATAVRTHNASLSRIRIITYDQLIDEAQRLLSGSDCPAD